MTRSNSLRALTLSAILALGAPALALAQPANTGAGSVPSELSLAQPMAVTRGSAIVPPNGVAENNSDDAQANGNPLAVQVPGTRQTSDNRSMRVGNGASASDGFGIAAQG